MFALKRQATPTVEGDLSAAIQRILASGPRADAEGRGPGVVGACNQALGVLTEAMAVLNEAGSSVRKAAGYVIEAASAGDTERALLAEKYDDARRRIDDVMANASEGALTLLNPGADSLSVRLTGASYAIAPFPLSTDEYGLDLPPPAQGFVSHAEVADTLRRVEIALERIGRARTVYEEDATFLRRRAAAG